jgi:hypothetical protein
MAETESMTPNPLRPASSNALAYVNVRNMLMAIESGGGRIAGGWARTRAMPAQSTGLKTATSQAGLVTKRDHYGGGGGANCQQFDSVFTAHCAWLSGTRRQDTEARIARDEHGHRWASRTFDTPSY